MLELFAPTEVALAGEPCFRVLVPSLQSEPAVERVAGLGSPVAQPPVEPVRPVLVAPRAPESTRQGMDRAIVVEETQRAAECIRAARQALGPDANPADIRETARMTYEHLFSHRALA